MDDVAGDAGVKTGVWRCVTRTTVTVNRWANRWLLAGVTLLLLVQVVGYDAARYVYAIYKRVRTLYAPHVYRTP